MPRTEEDFLRTAAEEYQNARAPFEIVKEKTALLVIDMLEAFVSPDGAYFLPENEKILPKVKKLIQICRKLKVPIIYTTEYFHPKGYDKGLMWDMPINKDRTRTFIEGSKGVRIYHEIAPKPDDIVIVKKRYSAFHDTNLDSILRSLGKGHDNNLRLHDQRLLRAHGTRRLFSRLQGHIRKRHKRHGPSRHP